VIRNALDGGKAADVLPATQETSSEDRPLTPGRIARRILGRHFKPLGDAYRRVFVDLEKIAEAIDGMIPTGARILDIGGGDGALVDRLLDRRPDLRVAMCDLAPEIGCFISPANQLKVELLPATDFTQVAGEFNFVTLCDVAHHIPVAERGFFFEVLAQCCERWSCRNFILKDIEPGGIRAALAKWGDWYVSGERQVVPFSRGDFIEIATRSFPHARRMSVMPDSPNYCEFLSW
jgi:hypothetical protein